MGITGIEGRETEDAAEGVGDAVEEVEDIVKRVDNATEAVEDTPVDVEDASEEDVNDTPEGGTAVVPVREVREEASNNCDIRIVGVDQFEYA
ncbi:hypothetical protein MMC08_008789 [Hypocenomyce scalaris]|nr:hypothetical protein [Hypocenomyce scalaris]